MRFFVCTTKDICLTVIWSAQFLPLARTPVDNEESEIVPSSVLRVSPAFAMIVYRPGGLELQSNSISFALHCWRWGWERVMKVPGTNGKRMHRLELDWYLLGQ